MSPSTSTPARWSRRPPRPRRPRRVRPRPEISPATSTPAPDALCTFAYPGVRCENTPGVLEVPPPTNGPHRLARSATSRRTAATRKTEPEPEPRPVQPRRPRPPATPYGTESPSTSTPHDAVDDRSTSTSPKHPESHPPRIRSNAPEPSRYPLSRTAPAQRMDPE